MKSPKYYFWKSGSIIAIITITIIIEMCLYDKIFNNRKERHISEHIQGPSIMQPLHSDGTSGGYVSGVYYSNWSPYEPRKHFPHDIDFSRISHVYYSFALVNGDTGNVELGDEWSDVEMDLYKALTIKLSKLNTKMSETHSSNEFEEIKNYKDYLPKGCIGEFFYLRNSNILSTYNNEIAKHFKLILTIGGWSNKDSFPKMAKSQKKINNFINSSIDLMFKYGFDGIDLDWEFPSDDGKEPEVYLQIMKGLKTKMKELEDEIYGNVPIEERSHHFQLSSATPAFEEKLAILPIQEMNKYIDYWNMMTYDFSGEWSEKTGYHSNLFKSENKNNQGTDISDSLDAASAIKYMTDKMQIPSSKIVLGLAAYGRGFTHVKANSINKKYINLDFSGVGGASEGEPGIWQYNQLPIKGSEEQFDYDAVSAFCYDSKTRTFVGYDNPESMKIKADYVRDKHLAGGFWWESCGDVHDDPSRSLLTAFTSRLGKIKKNSSNNMYNNPLVWKVYVEKYGYNGFLSSCIQKFLTRV